MLPCTVQCCLWLVGVAHSPLVEYWMLQQQKKILESTEFSTPRRTSRSSTRRKQYSRQECVAQGIATDDEITQGLWNLGDDYPLTQPHLEDYADISTSIL